MSTQTGYLTIYSPDRTEIYGEFAGAEWTTETVDGEINNVFIGMPSEGTLETFLRLDKDAISHVAYIFQSSEATYTGAAEFLAPIVNELPLQPEIRFETTQTPALA